MTTYGKKHIAAVLLAGFACASYGGTIFKSNFDKFTGEVRTPDGFRAYGAGVTDSGISRKMAASGKQAAFIALRMYGDFWGGLFMRKIEPTDMTGATLSVEVAADTDLSSTPMVAFKLIDADGSEFRTPDAMRLSPTTTFQRFQQAASQLSQCDKAGAQPGLDLENIVAYAVVFFDPKNLTQDVVFYMDDFTITK